MSKLPLVFISVLSFSLVYSQQGFLLLKKRDKSVKTFWTGSTIAFQLRNQEWQKGELTKIDNDSFYIRPMIVQYRLMGADTFHYPVLGFALSDVYVMPKKGYLIDYVDGRFQISRSGGHVHWYWIKSGWIFRVGGAAYAGVNTINGAIQNDLSSPENKMQLGIAAAVFLVGVLLQKIYKPTLRLGGKYHLQIVNLSN
jgi:hypothetical protein